MEPARSCFISLRSDSIGDWCMIPKFEAGKKVHKRALEQRIKEMEEQEVAFISQLKKMASKHNWPWDAIVRSPPLT